MGVQIILRGRQQHLFVKFRDEHTSIDEALGPANAAWKFYARKYAPLLPPTVTPQDYPATSAEVYGAVLRGGSLAGGGIPPGDGEAKLKMHLRTLAAASEALVAAQNDTTILENFYAKTEDILLPYLDSQHGTDIDASDHDIFTRLTKKYEDRFMEDMRALNCLDADVVTRVTEYVPQIVRFVEKIIGNDFAYTTSDGSVYFDIDAFERGGKSYARLEPWNRGDKDLQADGEGSLAKKSSEKRSDADFALWKSSKPGEPSWDSPWGKGRPGWHIECSVMASDVLGRTLDLHSGGIDLAFPHHDNELAQSEAYFAKDAPAAEADAAAHDHPHAHLAHDDHQWVNYFLHMGHLSIAGAKMSKSLKNFTTVRAALARAEWTPRSLRTVFLLGPWRDGIEITDELVRAGAAWEDRATNFFLNARRVARNHEHGLNVTRNGLPAAAAQERSSAAADDALLKAHADATREMHDALCDSFNTPRAMRVLAELIATYNATPKALVTDETTAVVAAWVTQMVRIFGLDDDSSSIISDPSIGWSGINIPAAAAPFVHPASALRDAVRAAAKAGALDTAALVALSQRDAAEARQPAAALPYAEVLTQFQSDVRGLARAGAPAKDYLALCDALRDVRLWALGIYLEDMQEDGQPALVRPLDRALVAAREEREARERERAAAKTRRDEDAKAKAEKGRLDPREMFTRSEEYGAWDEDGVPTADAQGVELPKSKAKKLRKAWETQRKAHEAWTAEQKA